MEDEERSQEGEEEEVPKNPITQEMIDQNLGQIGKTADGMSFAFTKLTVEEKEIDIIGHLIQKYKHLRNFSVANNQLKAIQEVRDLPDLLYLNASHNEIKAMDIFDEDDRLESLQYIDLSHNKIKEITEIVLDNLMRLNMNNNEIASALKFTGHPMLKMLELRSNKLANLKGIQDCPLLEELYVAENEITTIEGLSNLPALKTLHIRKNQLQSLASPPNLPVLKTLNIRENQFDKLQSLIPLEEYASTLEIVSAQGNSCVDEAGEDCKRELIIICGNLSLLRFGKEEIKDADYKEALDERRNRWQTEFDARAEIERQKKEAEEEAEKARLEAEAEAEKARKEAEAEAEKERLANQPPPEEGAGEPVDAEPPKEE